MKDAVNLHQNPHNKRHMKAKNTKKVSAKAKDIPSKKSPKGGVKFTT